MIVAVIGTFGSGFEIIGPFDTEEDAQDKMQSHPGYKYNGESWWVVEITDPESF